MELLLSRGAAAPLQSTPVFCGACVRVTLLQRETKSRHEYLAAYVLQGLEIRNHI